MLAQGTAPPGAVAGASSSRGTSPQPAPWPKSPQGKLATTPDWPCPAGPTGSSDAGHPRGLCPGFGQSPPPTHKSSLPGHAAKPPLPEPGHPLICGYHAIHRVLSRVGLSPELAYPLPTTDQVVHQIRRLVCEILAAAAEKGKLLLQTARPTPDQASAPLQADTYTDTAHPTAQSPPMPLPSCCSPGDPTPPTIARILGPRDTGLPHPPKQQHAPTRDPPAGHPSPPPTLDNPPTPTEGSPGPHGTPSPPSGPHTPPAHTPENPGPPPPAPECSPRELFPPADVDPHSLTQCRMPRPTKPGTRRPQPRASLPNRC